MAQESESLPPGPALIRAATIVTARYNAWAAECGLTPQQARLLFIMHRRPRNMLGLGESERLSKSTMTGVVARMERAGLVTRSPDPDDRRNLVVAPSPHGVELIERFERGIRDIVSELLAPLDESERFQLAELLSSLVRADEVGR
jgi:DNA-binding MarR family transcriptional regulator